MLTTSVYASLDVGEVRIGIASTPKGVQLAQPRGVIINDEHVVQSILEFIANEQAEVLVVGLPRGLQGQETAQTKYVRDFVLNLQKEVTVPVVLQDEALTSHHAEEELESRGKPYDKGDVDALSACYILDDYLKGLPMVTS
jgi:putative Holliday junction resolvase